MKMFNPFTLKDLRRKKNLTQKEVADAIGMTMSSISRFEVEGTLPVGEPLKKLITFFELDEAEVMAHIDTQTQAASEPPARYNTDSGTHPLLEQYRVLLESQQRMVEAQAKTIDTLNGVIDRLTNSITPNSPQQ
jgi:transcriptional regulator with XRE-family HTH domain